jgi:predicted nucleic acid-binding protein
MITAVDSNILIDIIIGSEEFKPASVAALARSSMQGVVVISDIVYSEVCTAFDRREECDEFLGEFRIKTEALDPASSFIASRSWISYLKSGGKRPRILPDFLIAAHAANQADRLLTRDRGFFRSHFPRLSVIDPSKP